MDSLLDTLYKEYRALHEKQKVVAKAITTYGGKIPSMPAHEYSSDILEAAFEDMVSYPSDGTWKEKILFALKESDKPSTVSMLSKIILKYQPKTDLEKIVGALTQTCSAMAVDGDIDVEKGYRNKYSLKNGNSEQTA